MALFFTLDNLVALATLTSLEIVLGIDNVVFIAILAGKLAPEKQGLARRVGLGLAMLMRIVLLMAITWVMGVMLTFAGRIAAFIERHPTMKILALSFLILIGVVLVAEGLHMHIPKGYVYFSMAFALGIEMLNLRLRKAPARKS